MAMIIVPRLNYREIFISLRDLGFNSKPPLDITGARVIFTVKEHLTDDETLIRIQKDTLGGGIEIAEEEGGEITLVVTPGDMSLPPSDYYYDVFVQIGDKAYSSEPDIFRVTPTVLGVLP